MEASHHYEIVKQAIRYLVENRQHQPTLDEMAEQAALSPFYFQRIFSEWAGISPNRFLQHLNLETLKKEVLRTTNLNEAAEAAGLSSPSRVYDLFTKIEAVTPQEYKKQGEGISIDYGFYTTPFGRCLLAHTERGICGIQFADQNEEEVLQNLKEQWPKAIFRLNPESGSPVVQQLFDKPLNMPKPLNLYLKGTPFQIQVWKALLKIPFGELTTYQSISTAIGKEKANRAVGSAVGKNPLAFLIPCHRVIRSEGLIGHYHWGSERKTAIIGWEKGQLEKLNSL